MSWHPSGRATVSATQPRALGICDRCGLQYNLQNLQWQFDWGGKQLINKRILVCSICLDKPQQQLMSIILPPDPEPVLNPRPEAYNTEVPSFIATQPDEWFGADIVTEDGDPLIWEIEDTPSPDPDAPVIYPD